MRAVVLSALVVACATKPVAAPRVPSRAAAATAEAPKEPIPADRAGCTKAFDEGRYETASKCFRALHTQSKDPAYLLLLGRTFELNRDLAHAVDAYSEYLADERADPNERRVTANRIKVLKEKMAVAQGAEALYEHGQQLENEGRWEEAASAYQRYLFAKGDSLSYIDRSSMELRIAQLREKAATSRSAESPRR